MLLHLRLITLNGVTSKSLKKADIVIPIEAEIQEKIQIQDGMAKVEASQSVVTQVSNKETTAIVMLMRGRHRAHIRCKNTASLREVHKSMAKQLCKRFL